MITVQVADPDVWQPDPGFHGRPGKVEHHGPVNPAELTALPCSRCQMRNRCDGECQAFADYVKHGSTPRERWSKKRKCQSGVSIGVQQS